MMCLLRTYFEDDRGNKLPDTQEIVYTFDRVPTFEELKPICQENNVTDDPEAIQALLDYDVSVLVKPDGLIMELAVV